MTYSEVLARLETITGHDRQIDCMIGYAINLESNGRSFRRYANERECNWAGVIESCAPEDPFFWSDNLPQYTACLHAVWSLVESTLPPSAEIGVCRREHDTAKGRYHASVEGEDAEFFEFGQTPALALLKAVVRVLADREAAK